MAAPAPGVVAANSAADAEAEGAPMIWYAPILLALLALLALVWSLPRRQPEREQYVLIIVRTDGLPVDALPDTATLWRAVSRVYTSADATPQQPRPRITLPNWPQPTNEINTTQRTRHNDPHTRWARLIFGFL